MNNNYYNNCNENITDCRHDCKIEGSNECDKYKQKSDELYVKAHHVQDESKRLICEARELDEQAKELERRSREICANANMTWNQARKFESEANNLLDLASFYCHKAAECNKNMNNSCLFKPTCNMGFGGNNCNKCY